MQTGTLTGKQADVLRRFDLGYNKVLFSGGRAAGKTLLAHHWVCDLAGRGHVPVIIYPNRHAREFADYLFNQRGWHCRLPRRSRSIVHLEEYFSPGCDNRRYTHIAVEQADQMPSSKLERLFFEAEHGGQQILFTSLVSGPGLEFLRGVFPVVGDCGWDRYHVNANMDDNPFLDESLRETVRRLMP